MKGSRFRQLKKVVTMLCTIAMFATAIMINPVTTSVSATGANSSVNKHVEWTPYAKDLDTGMKWPDGQAFPQFATPADTLDALNINTLPDTERAMFTALEGLVNKTKPRIIIYGPGAEGKDFWPDTFNFKRNEYGMDSDRFNLIQKYQSELSGIVLYSMSKSDHYMNLAGTIAGIRNLLPVCDTDLAALQAAGITLPTVINLTGLTYTTAYDIYNYMYNTYYPECTKKLIVSQNPANANFLRDMAAATGAAIVWLDVGITSTDAWKNATEANLFGTYLNSLTAGKSYIFGWFTDERGGIKSGTTRGIATVPGDFYENSTVYGGMSHQLDYPTVPKKSELGNNVYITLYMSDGDNAQYCEHNLKNIYEDQMRGVMPVNWTVSPSLMDLSPQILNYYYQTATSNDCFVAGPSGMGYSMFYNVGDSAWYLGSAAGNDAAANTKTDALAKASDQYLKKTGMGAITVWDWMNNDQSNSFATNIRSLYGMTINNVNSGYSSNITVAGGHVPVAPLNVFYTKDPNEVYTTLKAKIDAWNGTSPLFLSSQVVAWYVTPAQLLQLKGDLEALKPGKVQFVRADNFFALYNQANSLPYNLGMSQRMNVTASDSTTDPMLAVDGSQSKMWTSSAAGDKWLKFDLGGTYSISRYVVKHAGLDDMDTSLNTKDFKFETSADGVTWTLADTQTGNTASATDIEFTTAIANVKYARLVVTNPGADGVARIGDVEIYGVGTPNTTTLPAYDGSYSNRVNKIGNTGMTLMYSSAYLTKAQPQFGVYNSGGVWNLGYFQVNDVATWNLDVTAAGTYNVSLNYSKGNTAGTTTAEPGLNLSTSNGAVNTNLVLTNTVDWNTHNTYQYGSIYLPTGKYSISLKGLVTNACNFVSLGLSKGSDIMVKCTDTNIGFIKTPGSGIGVVSPNGDTRIGNWKVGDSVYWTNVNVPVTGMYNLIILFSRYYSPTGGSSVQLKVTCGNSTSYFLTNGTDTWEDWWNRSVGPIRLEAGSNTITFTGVYSILNGAPLVDVIGLKQASFTLIQKQYNMNYNANGGSGGNNGTSTVRCNYTDSGKVLDNMFTAPNNGLMFDKWNTAANGTGTSYSPNDVYSAGSDVTLYAIWKTKVFDQRWPLNLAASNVMSSTATLSWLANNDGTTTSYKIYKNDVVLTTVTGTSYAVTGLAPDTSYTFKVSAVNSSGTESQKGTGVTFKTTIATDNGAYLTPDSATLSTGIWGSPFNVGNSSGGVRRIGSWGLNDAAVWKIDVKTAGDYKLILNYAKGNTTGTTSSAINVYTANGSVNTNITLTNTGGWEQAANFWSLQYGTLTLPVGQYDFKVKGLVADVMNLQSITLLKTGNIELKATDTNISFTKTTGSPINITQTGDNTRIGNWKTGDSVQWTNVTVPQTGIYRVYMYYARVQDAAAGSVVNLSMLGNKTRSLFTLKGTSTWEDWTTREATTLMLTQGTTTISFTSRGSYYNGANLADTIGLKAVSLVYMQGSEATVNATSNTDLITVNNSATLSCANADVVPSVWGNPIKIANSQGGVLRVGSWWTNDVVVWKLDVKTAGNYKFYMNYSKGNTAGVSASLTTANGAVTVSNISLSNTGGWEQPANFITYQYGTVSLPVGQYEFRLTGLVQDVAGLAYVTLSI